MQLAYGQSLRTAQKLQLQLDKLCRTVQRQLPLLLKILSSKAVLMEAQVRAPIETLPSLSPVHICHVLQWVGVALQITTSPIHAKALALDSPFHFVRHVGLPSDMTCECMAGRCERSVSDHRRGSDREEGERFQGA